MSKDLILSTKTRRKLKRPLGRLIEKIDDNVIKELAEGPFVTVGDRVTETFTDKGLSPLLEIVDAREMRRERKLPKGLYQALVKVRNPAGTITEEAMNAIRESFKKGERIRILVDGEEDLLALPCIYYGPNGLKVLYGQPKKGIVCVEVNEKSRLKAKKLLMEMGMKESL